MKEPKLKVNNSKGITLVALVISIIVLLILATVSISLVINNGILDKAKTAVDKNFEAELKEQVNLAYQEWQMKKYTGDNDTLSNVVETRLNESYGEENVEVSALGKSVISKVTKNGQEYEYTLMQDGSVEQGKIAYLDIADGNIDLYGNGYRQYTGNLQNINTTNNLTTYTGNYLITGTTTENVVRVCNEGTYDITIKNLNIDLQNKNGYCAFTGNKGDKATGCTVNIMLEGNNLLQGGSGAPGLGFVNATPNINDVTNGSKLTIQGNGRLESKGKGFAAGIGSGYSGTNASVGLVSNIIINSGNITAVGGEKHGAGIGGTCYSNANNIVINGGNINAQGIGWIPGIGVGDRNATADNIIINGGNINSNGISAGYLGTTGRIEINGGNINVSSSYGCGAIGSHNTSETGLIKITGGNINATSTIGDKIKNIIIEGGTIKTFISNKPGISCAEGGSIQITGGNILAKGKDYNIATYSGSSLVAYTPTNRSNDLYETQIKLNGAGEGKKITNITTSDNISYGEKDMYTLEDIMLYLYLPLGVRTISISTEDGTYSGTVETKETSEVVTLTKTN